MRPTIIALDEPVSNLDHSHRRNIINWINHSDRTFIITSHDLEMLMEVCERVFILNSGKIIADGNILEILGDQKLLNDNNLEQPVSLLNRSVNNKNTRMEFLKRSTAIGIGTASLGGLLSSCSNEKTGKTEI